MAELSAALRNAVGASSIIQHNLLKGEFRERRVISGIRPFIPMRYALTSGIIINASGKFSKQQDIIISDMATVPSFLASADLSVHAIESISGVIEVKSVATTDEIRKAVENVASVKRLASDEPRDYIEIRGGYIGKGQNVDKPFGGILFLDSSISDEKILEEYRTAITAIAPNDRPNALVVVDRATLSWASYLDDIELTIQPEPLRGTHVVLQRLGKNSLLVFYTILLRILASYKPPELDIMNYIANSGGYGDYDLIVRSLSEE
jgi:hypothetical protein